MSSSTQVRKLSLEEARVAAKEATALFDDPENKKKMDEAYEKAGNDIVKIMQTVIPVAVEIQMPVIEKYGFPANQQGATQFVLAVKEHESDAEIAPLAAELKSKYMPQMKKQ